MRVSQVLSQFITLLLVMTISASLTSCQFLKPSKGGAPKPGAGQVADKGASTVDSRVLGAWQVSYAIKGATQSAHMTLTPNASGFEGKGTDDNNGQGFIIDSGSLSGNSVAFHKRYHVDENPNLPPVVYDGAFEMINNPAYKGPYMHGHFKLNKVGSRSVQGEWDAQKVDRQQAAQKEPPAHQRQASSSLVVDPSKAPDISGKWNAGYEYEFKTFHSRIFFEQDGHKITGHGTDKNTNESFTVSGYYNFPNIKIVHKYPELKLSKEKTKPARNLEFRGRVEVVSETEYQGPRISGKNMGGGDWMAEEIR